jgi:hypothetical protein
MSTRCVINFCDGDEVVAKIYRHSDGYPDTEHGVLADLQRFFETVKTQCDGTIYGTRFDDPSYLAAKFVVWQAMENAVYVHPYNLPEVKRKGLALTQPLNFGSLGILMTDPSDIEYRYFVDCEHFTNFPTVRFEPVREV